MNKHAVEHVNDSRYCFPIGGNKYRIRLRAARDDLKEVKLIWDSWCTLYKGGKKKKMELAHQDEFFDYFEADIENDEPGYSYVFELIDSKNKSQFYSEKGFSDTFNSVECHLYCFIASYPNSVDIIKQKSATDGRLYYQIFPERFAKYSLKKNTSYIDMDWYEDNVRNDKYMGGDLNGVIEKLDYLKSLGVGAIWFCPIHPSPSAHKYDVNNYFEVDPMFGTKKDLKHLCEEAHKRDIKIILDMVFNHCSYYNNLFQDVVKMGKKSKYYDWFFIEGDKPVYKTRNYLTFADVPMMPKINTNNPDVIEYFKKVVKFWVKECGVDGYRLDVAFEVSHHFWRELKRSLMAINEDLIIYGEQWLNSESRLDNSEWDSVMNYPFRYVVMNYYQDKKLGGKYLSDYLNSVLMRYKDTANQTMINMYASHDTARFLTELNNDRDAYFTAHAMLMFYPGNPEIYYGDEIFEVGQNDPYCRKGMKWNSKEFEGEDFKLMKEILNLRKYQVLRNGEYRIHNENDVVIFDRFIGKEKLHLAVHKGKKEVDFKVKNIVLSKNFEKGKFLKTGFVIYK